MPKLDVKNVEDAVDKLLEINHYDYSDSRTLKRLEQELYARTSGTVKNAKKAGSSKDYTSSKSTKKRSETLANYAQKVHDKYAERYPELCIEDALFDINHVCSWDAYNILNEDYYITYAIALFMLDKLYQANRLIEAIKYLPEYEGDVEMPSFEDSCHCRELIAKMVYVIENKDKCGPFALDFKGKRTYSAVPVYDGITNRERFDSIMSMLPSGVVEQATSRFKEKSWEFFEACLDIKEHYREKEIPLLLEIKANAIKQNEKCKAMASSNMSPLSQITDNLALLNSAATYSTNSLNSCKEYLLLKRLDEMLNLLSLYDGVLDDLYKDGVLERESYDKFNAFSVKDPYEIFFGFLYLLDSGDSLPWLCNQTMFVLQSAKNQLPWAFEDDGEIPANYMGETECLYKQDYNDACLCDGPVASDTKMNLAQIVFESTKIVIPRNFSPMARLEISGFEEAEARMLEKYLALIRFANCKTQEEHLMRKAKLEVRIEKEDTSEYKREIERLKDEVTALHKDRNESRKKAEKLNQENDELKTVVKELREIITKRKVEPVEQEQTEYPYELKHRFVVYGGHPTWRKAIKPLLQNIRFIEDSVLPNSDLIRNSDAVWVQSNAIGHSFYYKILDVTRTHNIPLQYFSAASAEKCAEQIIEYDRNFETDLTPDNH